MKTKDLWLYYLLTSPDRPRIPLCGLYSNHGMVKLFDGSSKPCICPNGNWHEKLSKRESAITESK